MAVLRGRLIVGCNCLRAIRYRQPPSSLSRTQHTTSRHHLKLSSISYAIAGLATGIATTIVGIDKHSVIGRDEKEEERASPAYPRFADRATMYRAVDEIRLALGDDAVSVDEENLETHSYSEWSTSNSTVRPVAVVTPLSTEDVSMLARICTRYKVPMIPYGAGSSVEGNISTPFSGITIDLSHMNRIVQFNEEDMDVVVEPGVNWVQLNEEIKSSGLFLPLDPSPTAVIGGMVATNCSGTNAMRYGTMKDWIVNLTVVLADGTVIHTRRRPRKSSAGYNLNALFTGSEGTLGIVTQITLKLAVLPPNFGVATASFSTVKEAATAASKMIREGVPLAALELMDDTQMKVVNLNGGAGGRLWPEKPTLFIKFSGTESMVQDSITRVEAICKAFGHDHFNVARSTEEMNSLWSARKEALWAMLAVRPEGTEIWSTDVAVPMSRMAEIIDYSKHNASSLGLFSSVLGHVGDGNFHQAVMYNPANPADATAVRDCVQDMVDKAIEMEGTVSGEHGIGLGKKHCLEKELSPGTIGVMRALKQSLDPYWLLNPGKVFDFEA